MINIFETSFEARERRFQIEKLYHGETVDLVGVVTTDGVPQNITGYSVSGVFQPTSMNGSPDFYELSADIVDNKVIVHWEKGKDFGENSYMVWALLTDGDNASYPIVWRLDMAYSPSYPLSALDPIPKAIDFDKYDLLNAPWLPLSDVQSLEEDVLLSVADGFLPLSGGTIDGNLNVIREISAENFTAKAGVGINLGGNNVDDNGVAIGINSTVNHASIGIGNGIETDGFSNINVGLASKATGDYGIAFGQSTEVSSYGIAIGYDAEATDYGSIAVGVGTKAGAANAIQLGSTMVGDSGWNVQTNNTPHSLKVMDKMVLSGDELTLDPERIPYLSDYETKAQAAIDHEELSVELTAYVEERIGEIPQPSPPIPAGVLRITQNDNLVAEYNPDTGTNVSADIKVPDVPTDLSAFENSPGYATSAYVQEYVAEHAGTPADMSACLSSAEFQSESYLSANAFGELDTNAISLEDLGNKINQILQLLKRDSVGPGGGDPTKTYVKYADGTTSVLSLTGTLDKNSISNRTNAIKIKVGNTVTSIGDEAFYNCSMLASITIPDSVTSIGSYAFYNCQGLARVTIPNNVTSIGNGIFSTCSGITSIVLPNGITRIGDYTFFNCSNLATVTIPNSVTSIGQNVFKNCSGLTSITIPSSVTSIGNSTFGDCPATVTFEEKTMAEVQSMSYFRWGVGTNKIVCTDGTL